ncbi:flagellar hook-length control protein FliK [Amphritea sp.]|uniref:flagellar hook-length control protein FliK n=1 Tax=Amphritea sp. TaxID=1872502 RepID=UPI003A92EA7D
MDQTFSASGVGSLLSVGSVSSSQAVVTETPPVGALNAVGVSVIASFDQSMLQAQQQRSGIQGQSASGQSLPGDGGLLPAGMNVANAVAMTEAAGAQIVVDAVADVTAKSAEMTEQRLELKQQQRSALKADLHTELMPPSALSAELNVDLRTDVSAAQYTSVSLAGDETLKQIDQYRRADLAVAVDSALKRLTSVADRGSSQAGSVPQVTVLAEDAPLSAGRVSSIAASESATVASTEPVSQLAPSGPNTAPVSDESDRLNRSSQLPLSSPQSIVRESGSPEVIVNAAASLDRSAEINPQSPPNQQSFEGENPNKFNRIGVVERGLADNGVAASSRPGESVAQVLAASGATDNSATQNPVTPASLVASSASRAEGAVGADRVVESRVDVPVANGQASLSESLVRLQSSELTPLQPVQQSDSRIQPQPSFAPGTGERQTSEQNAAILPVGSASELRQSVDVAAPRKLDMQAADPRVSSNLVAPASLAASSVSSTESVVDIDRVVESRVEVPVANRQALLSESLARLQSESQSDNRIQPQPSSGPAVAERHVLPEQSATGVVLPVAGTARVQQNDNPVAATLSESLARLQSSGHASSPSEPQSDNRIQSLPSSGPAMAERHVLPEQSVTGVVLPVAGTARVQQNDNPAAATTNALASRSDSPISSVAPAVSAAQGASLPDADIGAAPGSEGLADRAVEPAVKVSIGDGQTSLSESLARLQSPELTPSQPVRQSNDATQASITPPQQPVNPLTGQVIGQAPAQPVGQGVEQPMAQAAGSQGRDDLATKMVLDKANGIDVGRGVDNKQEPRQESSLTSFADSLAALSKPTRTVQEPLQTSMPQGVKPGMPSWGPAVNDRVMLMASKNGQFAEIQLDPPELGSLQVKLHLKNDQVSVVFNTPHGSVREALEQNMPRLREMFAEQGLNLSESSVEDQSGGQQRDQSEPGTAFAGYQNDNADESRVESVVTESLSLVDYYA